MILKELAISFDRPINGLLTAQSTSHLFDRVHFFLSQTIFILKTDFDQFDVLKKI